MRLEEILERSAERLPNKTALVAGKIRKTYREIDNDANRLAHFLQNEAGVKRGDRVAVLLDNSVESASAIFGILKAGAVFMVINPTTKGAQLEFLLENARAASLFTDARKLAVVKTATASNRHLKSVVLVEEGSDMPPEKAEEVPRFSMSGVLKRYWANDQPPPKLHISIDLASLIYTSGSTGNPKGVMLTHANMVAAATSITTYLENVESDIILNVLPFSFDYGLYQMLMAFKFGGTLVVEKSFTYYHAVMSKAVEEKVTGLPIVPTISAMLLDMDLSKYDLSNLRYITNTAAALPTAHIQKLRERLPHVAIYSMYGLTECKRVSYLPPSEIDRRPGSVGIAMPDTEAYVVDDNDAPVGPGVVGELVVRGQNVMLGYWENPEATQKRLKPGKYRREEALYTGDLFKMDEDGFLYFVGRTDDIIKSRGEKVAPKEIENILHNMEGIKEAAVLGIPDVLLGEKIKAYISLSQGAELTDRQILLYCRQNLQDIMVPQEIEIRDSLPKNPSGKVDKIVLKAQEATKANQS